MIFTSDDIRSRLRETPFAPFRIVTTTNQHYDVTHPDLMLIARRFVVVGIPASEYPAEAEQVTRIPLVHVAELRDLPSPPSANATSD
jgi:hypothetical protein